MPPIKFCRCLLAALLFILPAPAMAQPWRVPCGDGPGIIALLEKRYGEQEWMWLLDAEGRMVQIFANPESGTWSELVTGAGGLTCLVRTGVGWQALPPRPDPGAPS